MIVAIGLARVRSLNHSAWPYLDPSGHVQNVAMTGHVEYVFPYLDFSPTRDKVHASLIFCRVNAIMV